MSVSGQEPPERSGASTEMTGAVTLRVGSIRSWTLSGKPDDDDRQTCRDFSCGFTWHAESVQFEVCAAPLYVYSHYTCAVADLTCGDDWTGVYRRCSTLSQSLCMKTEHPEWGIIWRTPRGMSHSAVDHKTRVCCAAKNVLDPKIGRGQAVQV